jgi:hypothetical protein
MAGMMAGLVARLRGRRPAADRASPGERHATAADLARLEAVLMERFEALDRALSIKAQALAGVLVEALAEVIMVELHRARAGNPRPPRP